MLKSRVSVWNFNLVTQNTSKENPLDSTHESELRTNKFVFENEFTIRNRSRNLNIWSENVEKNVVVIFL